MKKSCLIIIPAYNEEASIGNVLLKLISTTSYIADVIVVNDASKDQTAKIAQQHHVEVISHCTNLGYSNAILTGLQYADKHGYLCVILFDADGQHDANDIPKIFEEMSKSDADVIIGSRFLRQNAYKHAFLRRIGTSIFTTAISWITGKLITDPTSGFQAIGNHAFRYYIRSGNFPEYPDANIIILMLKLGFRIREVPVTMHTRLHGKGMHDSWIRNIKYTINMFYSILFSALKATTYRDRGMLE